MKVAVYFYIFVIFANFCSAENIEVSTKLGVVRGYIHQPDGVPQRLKSFLGIPFAEPPLGELRFRPPQPPKRWSNVFEAFTEPNSCEQKTILKGILTMLNPNTPISEDCLYLSVTAPADQVDAALPVVVWIYGGGFTSGTHTLEWYNRDLLAGTENLVVVGIQYRIGAFGFLTLDIDEAPGNVGLLDQVKALEWVHENIAFFGGDPNKVTIMGESAGAMSVALHLMSNTSRRFFSKAILESGGATPFTANQEFGVQITQKFAESLGCPTDDDKLATLRCLQGVDASKITGPPMTTPELPAFMFMPIFDGRGFLARNPENIMEDKEFHKVNILLGTTRDEGALFLALFIMDNNLEYSEDNLTMAINTFFPHYSNRSKDAVKFFYTNWKNPDCPYSRAQTLMSAMTDYMFVCPMLRLSQLYSEVGQSVYYYQFSHRSSNSFAPTWAGVIHGEELFYVFGRALEPWRGFTREEADLSQRMMRFWGNFARTGNPNVGPSEWTTETWPRYSTTRREYLDVKLEGSTSEQWLRTSECPFWEKYIKQLQDK